MEKIVIDGTEYELHVVEAFCELEAHDGECPSPPTAEFLAEGPDNWYRELMISHLNTFLQGWKAALEGVDSDIKSGEYDEAVQARAYDLDWRHVDDKGG